MGKATTPTAMTQQQPIPADEYPCPSGGGHHWTLSNKSPDAGCIGCFATTTDGGETIMPGQPSDDFWGLGYLERYFANTGRDIPRMISDAMRGAFTVETTHDPWATP